MQLMGDISLAFEKNEEDIFVCEIADEVVEAAAPNGEGRAASFTLSTCTFLTICPGP